MIYVNRPHATEHEVPGRRDPPNREATNSKLNSDMRQVAEKCAPGCLRIAPHGARLV
jgi:hypothetical protein